MLTVPQALQAWEEIEAEICALKNSLGITPWTWTSCPWHPWNANPNEPDTPAHAEWESVAQAGREIMVRWEAAREELQAANKRAELV